MNAGAVADDTPDPPPVGLTEVRAHSTTLSCASCHNLGLTITRGKLPQAMFERRLLKRLVAEKKVWKAAERLERLGPEAAEAEAKWTAAIELRMIEMRSAPGMEKPDCSTMVLGARPGGA